MGGECGTHERGEKLYTWFWSGKAEGKRPLGRARDRWEDNINISLRETRWEDTGWIHLPEDIVHWRVMNTIIDLSIL
jgi:hypothetical protein